MDMKPAEVTGRTRGGMNEDLLRLTVCGCWRDRWIETRTTGGMNEDLLRLTVCGCWRDRWIELQED